MSQPASFGSAVFGVEITADRRGARYLAVWSEDRGAFGGTPESEIFIRLLGRDGRPVGPPRRLSTMGPDGAGDYTAIVPAVAFNRRRREYLVAWQGAGSGEARRPCPPPSAGPGAPPTPDERPCFETDTEIYVRRVDGRGRPVGRQRRITATGPRTDVRHDALAPRVEYNVARDEYLVAYVGIRGVGEGGEGLWTEGFIQRLDARGREIGADDLQITRGPRKPVQGLDGLDVAYQQTLGTYVFAHAESGSSSSRVRVGRLSFVGKPVGRRFPVTPARPQNALAIALAPGADARRLLLAWQAGGGGALRTRLLAATGRPLRSSHRVPGSGKGHAHQPELVADVRRNRWLLAWLRPTSDKDQELYASAYRASGRPLWARPERLSKMGPDPPPDPRDYILFAYETALAAAPSGGFMAAWIGLERDDADREVYARRMRW